MEENKFGIKMLNKQCSYFPCHKRIEDCRYCYCPIYPCEYEEYGKFVVNNNKEKVWDCSNCVIFHKKKIIDLIYKLNKDFKKNE